MNEKNTANIMESLKSFLAILNDKNIGNRRYIYIYYKILFTLQNILTPPAKLMAIIWTASSLYMFTSKEHTFAQKLILIVFGYVFYCGIANFIYKRNKRKYYDYQVKTFTKQKEMLLQLFPELNIKSEEETEEEIISPQEENLEKIVEEESIINYDNMNGHEFEHYCADILRNNEFYNVEVTKASGDHGIDILATKDDIEYAIQCKCYSSNIGVDAVQQANAGKSIYKKDIAVVLTNQYFTQQAKDDAKSLGVKLWDRNKLNELIENTK